jgi:hypothetical protein
MALILGIVTAALVGLGAIAAIAVYGHSRHVAGTWRPIKLRSILKEGVIYLKRTKWPKDVSDSARLIVIWIYNRSVVDQTLSINSRCKLVWPRGGGKLTPLQPEVVIPAGEGGNYPLVFLSDRWPEDEHKLYGPIPTPIFKRRYYVWLKARTHSGQRIRRLVRVQLSDYAGMRTLLIDTGRVKAKQR